MLQIDRCATMLVGGVPLRTCEVKQDATGASTAQAGLGCSLSSMAVRNVSRAINRDQHIIISAPGMPPNEDRPATVWRVLGTLEVSTWPVPVRRNKLRRNFDCSLLIGGQLFRRYDAK